MCTEAAPEVGDAKLIAYCHAMREMGYFVGMYENFTDYNPLGAGATTTATAGRTEASGERKAGRLRCMTRNVS